WHWPMLSFARIFASGEISAGMRASALAFSFLFASLTYTLVERPIRFGPHSSVKVTALVALMVGVGAAGYFVFRADGLKSRVASLVHTDTPFGEAKAARLAAEYAVLNYDFKSDARWATCWLTPEGPEKYRPECVDTQVPGATPKPLAFVWGDSHAARLFPGIR